MTDTDIIARERILKAAIDLLTKEEEPERVTVRQIAQRAGVAVGAVNYHFQTKENLLSAAVAAIMSEAGSVWFRPVQDRDLDPVVRLRQLIKEMADIAARYPKLSPIPISTELLSGEMSVPAMLLPLLHEISGGRRSDRDLRLLAFQFITALQVALLRAEAFKRYSGVDLFAPEQREAVLDFLVNNFVKDLTNPG